MQHAVSIYITQLGGDALEGAILGDILRHDVAVLIISHYA